VQQLVEDLDVAGAALAVLTAAQLERASLPSPLP
jgi:hypothetical protein